MPSLLSTRRCRESDPNQIYGPCPICGAVGLGEWPHAWREPCPQKVKIDEAYVAMLDAQRMSYIRTGGAMGDVSSAFGKLTGGDDE